VAPARLRFIPFIAAEQESIHILPYGDSCHMVKYENQTLTNQVFQLEESWFVNCVLKGCTIFYSGGSFELERTRMENCTWKFQNEAQRTCGLLQQIGLLQIQQTLPQMTQQSAPVN
jgi:hypothetical protein